MEKLIYGKSVLKSVLQLLFCLGLCLAGMYYVLDLGKFNIHIPYTYTGDGLSSSLLIKGTIENGWYNVNPNLGAPFGLEMYDYPLGGDNFQYLIMKIIALFTGNYVVVMNTYYLLTFPLCMITAYMVLRSLKVNYYISLSISLLYTFLPYHIIRTGHLFLLGYYMVPLITLVILWLAHKENYMLVKNKQKYGFKLDRYFYASLFICILTGSTGAYYAFFSCFFLLVVGIFSWVNEKKFKKIISASLLIFFVAASLVINISPSIYSKMTNANNQDSVSNRNFEAAETYGLKIAQLLLPTTDHNVEWIKEKKNEYNLKAPLVNENDSASLGLIGSIGFLSLLICLFLRKVKGNSYNLTLSLLNLSAVLLGTIGGFGVLFAALISAQIRSYNRLSIFIAFFSFLFIALNIDRFINEKAKKISGKWIFVIFSTFIVLFGMFDQTSHPLVPSKVIAEEYNADKIFIQEISNRLPENSMIFQLPYVSFPEGENLNTLGNYDLLKGYIHSTKLSWSFGSMKNSFGDRWIKAMVKLPIPESLNILARVGYSGIYIDRNGYTEEYADAIVTELKKITEAEPLVSENKMLLFFDLTQYQEKLKKATTFSDWEKQKNDYLSSVIYQNVHVLSGAENWEFVKNDKGFKLIQTDYFGDLPDDQLSINIMDSNKKSYSFDDSFSRGNQYSNRHWEQPGHLVISLDNKITGWDDNYVPTSESIKEFFGDNKFTIGYTSDQDSDSITFMEH